MNKKTLVTTVLCLFILLNSCKDKITNPPEPEPGRRDYMWTVDTINPGQESLYLGNIWGSSPDDVWTVGPSSWSATSIWHYNGSQWRCDSIPRNVNPSAVFGNSNNEVWLGNGNSTIWKYDGTHWRQFGEYKIEKFDRVLINDFDGTSTTNIYGVGGTDIYNSNTYKAIIMRYNGYNWDFENIIDTKVGFETVSIDLKTGALVISGTVYDPAGFVAKVYSWDGKELKELLSGSGLSYVTKLGDEIFATLNSKIYKYVNKQLTLWKDNTGSEINGKIICGRNRNDFFISSVNGIAHYNGSDFSVIYKNMLGHNIETGIGTIFERDVFFIAVDFTIGKNLVIHGKLK